MICMKKEEEAESGWTEVKNCRVNLAAEQNVGCWTSQRESVIWCNTVQALH